MASASRRPSPKPEEKPLGITPSRRRTAKPDQPRPGHALLNESRIWALIENDSDAVILISADGTIRHVSPSILRLLGYDEDELAGLNAFTLAHPDDVAGLQASLTQLARDPNCRVGLQARLRRKDGSWGLLEPTITNLIGSPGGDAVSAAGQEAAKHRRSIEALREVNEKLISQARELERSNRELSLTREMGELLMACNTPGEAYRVIARFTRELFADSSGAVYLVDPAKRVAEPVAAWGSVSETEPVFERDDCWALRLSRPNVSAGPDADLYCRHLGSPPPQAALCVPMVGPGETLGVLHLRFAAAAAVEEYQQVARDVAERIVMALDNLKLREALRTQSIRDPLTHLFNRRYMEESLERELRRAARAGQPVAVVVFDLDHFKDINDTFGHEAGDVLLQGFGEFLKVRIREGDIACRYGGEEFVLILPGASLRDAAVRAHKLREGSRDFTVSFKGRTLGPLTISLGVAVFPEHGTKASELLANADQALYRAKQQGRDRVEIAKAATA